MLMKLDLHAGSPLMVIAGQGATSSVWTPGLLRGLAQARQVIIFDNMDIGLSTIDDDDITQTPDGYAAATYSLAQALELETPDVLGWSMGGSIALQTAVNYPGAFGHIVISVRACGTQMYQIHMAEQ